MKSIERIPILDGLRGVAILLVLLGHISSTVHIENKIHSSILFYFFNAPFGVTIFFVLSGYLITKILLKNLNIKLLDLLTTFYRKRFFRLAPAFFTFWVSLFIFFKLNLIPLNVTFWKDALLFIRDYSRTGNSVSESITGHAWSLNIEEKFYFVWPLIIYFFKKPNFNRYLFFGIFLAPFIRYYTALSLPAPYSGNFVYMFHCRYDTLLLGCILALVEDSPLFKTHLLKLSRKPFVFTFLILASYSMRYFSIRFGISFKALIGITIENVGAFYLIGLAVQKKTAECLWQKFLDFSFFQYFGRISYSLYLWQQPGWLLFKFPISIFLPIVFANLSYYFIEVPLLNFNSKISKDSKEC